MVNAPSNRDSVIDSRDVIKRIEELQSDLQLEYNDAVASEGRDTALEQGELERELQALYDESMEELFIEVSKDLESLDRDDWLGDQPPFEDFVRTQSERDTNLHFVRAARLVALWDDDDPSDAIDWDDPDNVNKVDLISGSDRDELVALLRLQEEAEAHASDWHHGETLIREDYFPTYAEELANDICEMPKDVKWPYTHIDWEAAAKELEQDYTTVDFDGQAYLVRTS